MKKSKFQVLLYYKYIKIDDVEKFRLEQLQLCEKLSLKGRIIIASEGINGTVEGRKEYTEKYIKTLRGDERFSDIHFKKSSGNGAAFAKLSIKVRDEIVSSYLNQSIFQPIKITGSYLTSEELHLWIKEKRRFFIVDMRNDYETAVGHFEDSIKAPFSNFRDLPKVLPILSSLKNEVVVTVCTGGVRCEKASGFLINNGFSKVYQLMGGIVSYMEKYPNQDFLGKLYVFDGRVTMGFNTDDPNHKVVGKCAVCFLLADSYYDCKNIYCQAKRHFISCAPCIVKSQGYCQSCFPASCSQYI